MKKSSLKLVPVTIDGITVRIDPNSIDRESRTVHHGEFKGTQVNSPATCRMGESILIWPDAKRTAVISMGRADLGVLATQFLSDEGQIVQTA